MSSIILGKTECTITDSSNTKTVIKYNDGAFKSLIPYLSYDIELAPDFTLLDMFKLFEQDMTMYDYVFSSHMGGHSLVNFCKSIKRKAKQDDDIIALVVEWISDISDFDDVKETTIYSSFSGLGTYDDNETEIVSYSLGLRKLSTLSNKTITINKTTKFIEYNSEIGLKELLVTEIPMTVYDFLNGILQEITFYGDIEDRKKVIKKINRNSEHYFTVD